MTKKDTTNDDAEADASRYDDALLSANWNPAIDLLACSSSPADEVNAGSTKAMSDAEVDALLGRIYMLGC
ncbi:MAG: hypothetical protein ACXWUH_15905 [Burkholderiales bacterium]